MWTRNFIGAFYLYPGREKSVELNFFYLGWTNIWRSIFLWTLGFKLNKKNWQDEERTTLETMLSGTKKINFSFNWKKVIELVVLSIMKNEKKIFLEESSFSWSFCVFTRDERNVTGLNAIVLAWSKIDAVEHTKKMVYFTVSIRYSIGKWILRTKNKKYKSHMILNQDI